METHLKTFFKIRAPQKNLNKEYACFYTCEARAAHEPPGFITGIHWICGEISACVCVGIHLPSLSKQPCKNGNPNRYWKQWFSFWLVTNRCGTNVLSAVRDQHQAFIRVWPQFASTRKSQNSLHDGNTPLENNVAQKQPWAESTLSKARIDLIRASSDQDGSIYHNKQLYCTDKDVWLIRHSLCQCTGT